MRFAQYSQDEIKEFIAPMKNVLAPEQILPAER